MIALTQEARCRLLARAALILVCAAAGTLSHTPVHAATCPYLTAAEAAKALLVLPTNNTVETMSLPKNEDGLRRAHICRFLAAGEIMAQVSVTVFEFAKPVGAEARYRRERQRQGNAAVSVKGIGEAAFLHTVPNLSGSAWALSGSRMVRVVHVYSKAVNAAIERDPNRAVIGSHELARQVLARLDAK